MKLVPLALGSLALLIAYPAPFLIENSGNRVTDL